MYNLPMRATYLAYTVMWPPSVLRNTNYAAFHYTITHPLNIYLFRMRAYKLWPVRIRTQHCIYSQQMSMHHSVILPANKANEATSSGFQSKSRVPVITLQSYIWPSHSGDSSLLLIVAGISKVRGAFKGREPQRHTTIQRHCPGSTGMLPQWQLTPQR